MEENILKTFAQILKIEFYFTEQKGRNIKEISLCTGQEKLVTSTSNGVTFKQLKKDLIEQIIQQMIIWTNFEEINILE